VAELILQTWIEPTPNAGGGVLRFEALSVLTALVLDGPPQVTAGHTNISCEGATLVAKALSFLHTGSAVKAVLQQTVLLQEVLIQRGGPGNVHLSVSHGRSQVLPFPKKWLRGQPSIAIIFRASIFSENGKKSRKKGRSMRSKTGKGFRFWFALPPVFCFRRMGCSAPSAHSHDF
jgi:hypothetical protein